jgi:arabinofuranan 3-O-arabinosyltransferase
MTRRVRLPAPAAYTAALRVRGVPGPALDGLVQQGSFVDVEASSTSVADPRASALSAVDGNGSTTWSADVSDVRPTLRLRWLRPQTIDSIDVRVDANTAARAPQSLELRWPGGRRAVELDEDGSATFRPIRTTQLSVDVDESEPATTVDFSGATGAVPVGITELRLGGAQGLPALVADEPLELPCGAGPEVDANGVRLRTSVTATARELFAGATVPATPCGIDVLALRAGDNTVSIAASDAFTPVSAVLDRGDLPLGEGTPVEGGTNGRGDQSLVPEPGHEVIAGHRNTNPGWQATQNGQDLDPVTVDGWRQGWRSSGATAEVAAEFAPGTTYRWALLVGATAVLALIVFLLLGGRRRRDVEPPGLGERRLPTVLVLAPASGALLAGPVGLLVATIVAGVVLVARTAVARGLVALLVLPAVGVYAFLPWGGLDDWAGSLAWPSYLVVAVVSGLLGLVAVDSRRRSRPLSRRAGSSTSR